jgi:hypothetical protein
MDTRTHRTSTNLFPADSRQEGILVADLKIITRQKQISTPQHIVYRYEPGRRYMHFYLISPLHSQPILYFASQVLTQAAEIRLCTAYALPQRNRNFRSPERLCSLIHTISKPSTPVALARSGASFTAFVSSRLARHAKPYIVHGLHGRYDMNTNSKCAENDVDYVVACTERKRPMFQTIISLAKRRLTCGSHDSETFDGCHSATNVCVITQRIHVAYGRTTCHSRLNEREQFASWNR